MGDALVAELLEILQHDCGEGFAAEDGQFLGGVSEIELGGLWVLAGEQQAVGEAGFDPACAFGSCLGNLLEARFRFGLQAARLPATSVFRKLRGSGYRRCHRPVGTIPQTGVHRNAGLQVAEEVPG